MRITALMLYGAYALMSAPVVAQPVAKTADPALSGTRVPEIKYDSAFGNYVPYREQPLATWREVNDEVGRVGGHLGMFRGGGDAAAKPPSKPAAGAGATNTTEAVGRPPARTAPTAPGTHTGR